MARDVVRVGLVDTGIDPSAVRPAVITDWIDLTPGASPTPVDPYNPEKRQQGHGTSVARVLVETLRALSPDTHVELAVARVGSESGIAPDRVRRAIHWLRERDVAAANFSVGADPPSDVDVVTDATLDHAMPEADLPHAFRSLHHAGVVGVASGGNGATNGHVAPHAAFAHTYSDMPWVLSVALPTLLAGWNTDVAETSSDGSSQAAPQTTAKAALLNRDVRDPDLVAEALMATAEVRGPSEPAVMPARRDRYPSGLRATLDGQLRTLLGRGIEPDAPALWEAADRAAALLLRPGVACDAPGRCGWGYPRYRAAREHVRARKGPDWYRAGELPRPVADARWAGWAPGYAVRLRHAGTVAGTAAADATVVRAEGAIETVEPIGPGLVVAGGSARVVVRTAVGDALVAGFGVVRTVDNAIDPVQDGLTVIAEDVVASRWLPNGRWFAITRGAPTALGACLAGVGVRIPL